MDYTTTIPRLETANLILREYRQSDFPARIGHLPPVHAAGQSDIGYEQVDVGAGA